MPTKGNNGRRKFTVPVVWRRIVKKNERQGAARFDVLICNHVVPADDENAYRRARSCPECRLKVQEYADQHQHRLDEEARTPQGAPAAASRPKPAARERPKRTKRTKRTKPSLAWCVYVLRCADGSLYTGVTNDLARRLERHAAGVGARYTRSRLPVVLVHEERVVSQSAALRRELAVKRLGRKEKLALVASGPVRSKRRRAPKARPPRA